MSDGGMPVKGYGRGRASGGVVSGAVAGWWWVFVFFPA